MPTVILHDAARQTWLRFTHPVEICQARQVEQVLPALQKVSSLVESKRLYAAGFLSYEAAPAFDTALQTHSPDHLPLLWFGLYEEPEVIHLPDAPRQPGYQFGKWAANLDNAAYAEAIVAIKAAIARGETYQVNFTLRLRASFSGEPWALFLQLNQNQRSRYAAYIETDDFVICSASPELFFQLEGETIVTRPMKGTARRGLTTIEDRQQQAWLQDSEKNRAENVMIVDMLRNDLGRIATTGSVQVQALFDVERYPTVWQMTSTVTACTRASLPEIFSALFPCASITGAPKVRTMQIIKLLECEPRQVYTGSIGFIAPGRRAQFNVAIRSVLIDRQQQQAEYGVGGGIIWDSDTADEYQECLIKARVLSQDQPRFALLETLLWEPDTGYFLLDRHLDRLEQSAEYFAYPFDRAQIDRKLQELAASFSDQPQRVRLLLDDGGQLGCQAAPACPGSGAGSPAAETGKRAGQFAGCFPLPQDHPPQRLRDSAGPLYAGSLPGLRRCDPME